MTSLMEVLQVAPILHMVPEDLPNELNMQEYIGRLLEDPNTYTPAIGLLMHFPQYLYHFNVRPLFASLLECNHESLCERWATSLDEAGRIEFIEECLLQSKMKVASSAVRKFDLVAKYPHVERQYKEATIMKLLGKSLWSPAARFAGEDRQFQVPRIYFSFLILCLSS